MNSFARAGPTDVSNFVGHWCFAIHPLVKHHIASNHNTRTIRQPNDTAATVIVGLEITTPTAGAAMTDGVRGEGKPPLPHPKKTYLRKNHRSEEEQ
jgi:hypothetical protein